MSRMRSLALGVAFATLLLSAYASGVSADRAEAPSTSTARTGATRISAGQGFNCVLNVAGTIRCWGDNTYGQLGNGSKNPAGELSPVAVLGISNAVEISAGANHACALLADKRVKCWGYGYYGQIGVGTTLDVTTPQFVKNSSGSGDLTGVSALSAGYANTCVALEVDGSVYCWGFSFKGGLGNGVTDGSEPNWQLLPVPVKTSAAAFLTGATEVATGQNTACAITASAVVYCWGANSEGRLGLNNTADSGYAVQFGGGNSGATAVTVGASHICVAYSASYACSGGATGDYAFTAMLSRSTPQPFPESGLKQIAAGNHSTCVLDSGGNVKCAGTMFAATGTAPEGIRGADGSSPTANWMFATVDGISGATAITVGANHACATVDAGIRCWGRNDFGQIGKGSRSDYGTVTTVINLEPTVVTFDDPGAKNVDSGTFNVAATASSGTDVTYSVDASSTGVCSLVGRTVTVLDAGSCVVIGSSAATGIYSSGSASRTVTISPLGPVVGSGSAGSVTRSGATLTASVNAKGASTVTTVEYGTDATLSSKTSVIVPGTKTGIVASAASETLSGLKPGVTYYFRFSAANSVGTATGAIASFTTVGAAPTVATGVATADATTATLAADVNANEVDATVSFEYGTSATLAGVETAAVAAAVTGTTAKSVSATLSKLSPGTTYYFRVVAVNAVGTSRGDIKSFTTKGAKPTATTGSATRGTSGMTVNGKVNARDLETSVRFEYSLDAKLIGAQQTAARTQTGGEETDVSAVISGLAENTTYYYRIVATNVVGSSEGEIRSFTTLRPEGVSINDGDEFTSSQNVVVSVVGPSTAVKAILSNDGGFKTSEAFDLVNNSAEIKWQLQSSREGTFTKIVYVKYVTRFGSQLQAITDDIILDTTKPVVAAVTAAVAAPTGSAVQVARTSGAKAPKASGGVRLSLRGSDTISGIGKIEVRSAANKPSSSITVSRVAGKADGKPRAASQTVTLRTGAKRLQVRVVDRAGNASAWRTIVVR